MPNITVLLLLRKEKKIITEAQNNNKLATAQTNIENILFPLAQRKTCSEIVEQQFINIYVSTSKYYILGYMCAVCEMVEFKLCRIYVYVQILYETKTLNSEDLTDLYACVHGCSASAIIIYIQEFHIKTLVF